MQRVPDSLELGGEFWKEEFDLSLCCVNTIGAVN